MASLKEVKNRIQSVNSTQQITKAMKMVAAAKLRKAQENIIQIRPYVKKLDGILHNLTESIDTDNLTNIYAEEREVEKILVVVISSDRGLCGAFNNATFKYAMNMLEEDYAEQMKHNQVFIMPIGKKAHDFFRREGKLSIIDTFALTLKDINFENIKKAAEFTMDAFTNKDFDKVHIVYNEFKNVATQILHKDQFLPVIKVDNDASEDEKQNTDYIFLPNQEKIVQSLIPKSLKVTFYKAVLESYAAEMGARMTAMDKATENASDLIKELKLTYNRTRQAAITNEILEIVGGAEALANA